MGKMAHHDGNEGGGELRKGVTEPRRVIAAVYDALADDLFRFAAVLLTDPGQAEDAVQQAFVKLAGMGKRIAGINSYDRYMRQAVRHECYRVIKLRRGGDKSISVDFLALPATPTSTDNEQRDAVQTALRTLPPDQREVVYLKVYEDRTFQEIAELLDVSINTAASRYRYALHKLRERLQRYM